MTHSASTRAAGTIQVTPLGERTAAWDTYVDRAADATFAHRAAWTGIMRDVFRHECEYLVAEDASGAWRGVLPLVHIRGVLGHYVISVPFLNDGGPIGEPAARSQLVEAAVTRATSTRPKLLEFRARQQVDGPVQPRHRKVAVHLELPATEDELWTKTFPSKLRSQIRRASKEGMVARSGPSELEPFYSVFARNMRDLGTPVLPQAFFAAMRAAFGDDVSFTTVYTSTGVPVAAACCLTWRRETEVTWASSLREYNRFSPNMRLYATLMEDAVKRGIRTFNFGRSTPGSSTHKFKQQWGGQDVALPWAAWTPDGHVPASDTASAPLRMAVEVWKRLPLPLVNRIGPMISRQLPW